MNKVEHYRNILKSLETWDAFLLQESGLPGPRANLELVQAAAEEGDESTFLRFLSFGPGEAPTNFPQEFLAVCGVVGLGRLVAEGKTGFLDLLRQCASDPRWRIREGVAMALQRYGEANMDSLLQEMERWSLGSLLEKRASAAALCEPKLLQKEAQVKRVLEILEQITESVSNVEDRKS